TRDLALSLYEASIYRRANEPYYRLNFDRGPARRLVTIHERENRRDEARRVLIDFTKFDDLIDYYYDTEYMQQLKLQAYSGVGRKLAELGFATDAVSFFSKALAIEREIPPGGSRYIGNLEMLGRQCREGLSRALQDLKSAELTAAFNGIVEAGKSERAGSAAPDPKTLPGRDRARSKPRKPDQAVDLMVLVHPRGLDKAELRSLLAEAIVAVSSSDRVKELESLVAPLEALRTTHPEDLSVAIAEALVALGSGDPKRIDPALDRLETLVDRTPLEPLS